MGTLRACRVESWELDKAVQGEFLLTTLTSPVCFKS